MGPCQYSGRLLALALLACTALSLLSTGPLAAVIPAGFSDTLVVGGLLEPIAIDWGPNSDLFVAEKRGTVKIIRGAAIINTGGVSVSTDDELGITGIAVDPDFATNGNIWIYYSTPAADRQRVSRLTLVNDAIVSETVMIEYPIANTYHHAGCLRFDTDKTLYISTGDDALRSVSSQNPFDLRGKILRINRDGTPAAGNPFFSGVSGDPRIWALGFRHPWRISFQPDTRNLFIADIGDSSWEELDIGIAGGNFGWAAVEGNQPNGQPGYVYPVTVYPHTSPLGNSIIGGEIADTGDFSPEYKGQYFFGDEAARELRRILLDADNHVTSSEVWATDVDNPVDIRFGPDGSLYYVGYSTNSVRKITFVGGANRPPLAMGIATPASGLAPLSVQLDGTGSSDPDSDPLTYLWDPGQGATGSTATVAHTYSAGVYQAKLTVSDGHGGTNTTPNIRIVSGNRPPVATITAPADQSRYDAGQTILFSGTGVDPESGNIACEFFTWTVVFHHIGHTHPHLGPIQGVCGGSFTIPQTGEASASTFYEIRLDVQDNGAPLGSAAILTGSRVIEVRPNTSQITLATSPRTDLTLTLDDALVSAPKTVAGVVQFFRNLGVVTPQPASDGHTYTFTAWSDGGAAAHTIVTQPTDTTYTAFFSCNVISEVQGLLVAPAPAGQLTLTWSPSTDVCLGGGGSRYAIYAAAGARPATLPGLFPVDPAFSLLGTVGTESFTFLPAAGNQFFLVLALGTDGANGPVGHYGR